MGRVFMPHELKSIEVDVESKTFKINGENFGNGCTGFTITCDNYDSFSIRVEIDTTVVFSTFRGCEQTSNSITTNNPWPSWYSSRNEGGNDGEQVANDSSEV